MVWNKDETYNRLCLALEFSSELIKLQTSAIKSYYKSSQRVLLNAMVKF